MKRLIYNIMSAFTLVLLSIVLVIHTSQLKKMEARVRIISENNIQLIGVNEALSKGVSDIAGKMIEQSYWDKDVSQKIKELNALVKGVYGKTNQRISKTVR